MHIRLLFWMHLFASGIASLVLSLPLCAATLSTSVTCGDFVRKRIGQYCV